MNKFRVTLHNEGGVLDSRLCNDEDDAAKAAADMILAAGMLCGGDTIVVEEIEE
jgi:hypothetical protein